MCNCAQAHVQQRMCDVHEHNEESEGYVYIHVFLCALEYLWLSRKLSALLSVLESNRRTVPVDTRAVH